MRNLTWNKGVIKGQANLKKTMKPEAMTTSYSQIQLRNKAQFL